MKNNKNDLEEYPYPGFGWDVAKCIFGFYGVLFVLIAIVVICSNS